MPGKRVVVQPPAKSLRGWARVNTGPFVFGRAVGGPTAKLRFAWQKAEWEALPAVAGALPGAVVPGL